MRKSMIFAFADEAGSSLDAQVHAMRRNGLHGVEIRGVDGENVSAISVNKAKEVRRILDDNDLVTWAVGSPIGKITLDEDFEKHLDLLRHTIEVANILNAQNIRIFSFYLPKHDKPETHRQLVMDRLNRLLELSGESGISLCHENEKGIYGDTALRCRDLLDTLPQLKAVFDPANFVQCGEDALFAWELLKDRTHYLHIKDALPNGGVVPAGQGAGNIAHIVKDYLSLGGRAMTLEPHLMEFDGLKNLEQTGATSEIGKYCTFPSADAAFDAGCSALRKILAEV